MTASPAPRVLYFSYDGALEPLGESQVVAYLRELAPRCAAVTLISFEKPRDLQDGARVARRRQELASAGIAWRPLRYHKRPSALATSYDIAAGIVAALPLVWRGIDVVHARSYVSALQAWCLKRLTGVAWIFDMRGFWADERVEGGHWQPGSFFYRLVKRLERVFLADADAIVTLTDRAAATVREWTGRDSGEVTVIPTCVDLARFEPVSSGADGDGPLRFVYAGSIGTCYAFDETLRFFARARLRFPAASLIVLTRNIPEARSAVARSDVPQDAVRIQAVAPADMPRQLIDAYAGLAFYKNGFGRQGTCPTKMGEYLAAGVPVVVNAAVGDVPAIIAGNAVGVVIDAFDDAHYEAALDRLAQLWSDGSLRVRCRRIAESVFSLQLGASRYWSIYLHLTSQLGEQRTA